MSRWTLVISNNTDRALRSFLALTGGKKGDLSHFVEKAVLQRLFTLTVDNVKERNSKHNQKDIIAAIEEALDAIRT